VRHWAAQPVACQPVAIAPSRSPGALLPVGRPPSRIGEDNRRRLAMARITNLCQNQKLKQKANEEISQARPRTVCSKPIIPVFKRPASAQGKDPTPRPPSGPPAKKAKMATPSEPPPTTQTRIRLTGVYGL